MTQQPGIVVLDNSCCKYFVDEQLRRQIVKSLYSVDFEIWPSAVNVLQLIFSPATKSRVARLQAMQSIAGKKPLLQWPYDLLSRVGRCVKSGQAGFYTGPSGLEWVLTDLPAPTDEKVVQARALLDTMDQVIEEAHQQHRATIQAFLRERKMRNLWDSIPAFLDEQWTRPEQVDTLVTSIWEALGLPDDPPIEELLETESWRLLVEGFGAALFDRVIVKNQQRKVELTDIFQLIYLGGTPRRLLVAEDAAFVRLAQQIIHGRYPGARVLSWLEFKGKH